MTVYQLGGLIFSSAAAVRAVLRSHICSSSLAAPHTVGLPLFVAPKKSRLGLNPESDAKFESAISHHEVDTCKLQISPSLPLVCSAFPCSPRHTPCQQSASQKQGLCSRRTGYHMMTSEIKLQAYLAKYVADALCGHDGCVARNQTGPCSAALYNI